MTTQADNPAPWTPRDTLALRLVAIRHELNLTQREAAFRSGVTFGTWQGMEKGRSPHRLDEQVQKISAAFGVDRDWLMWGYATSSRKFRPMDETAQTIPAPSCLSDILTFQGSPFPGLPAVA
jgi:transcriptional regulator with XRE-family HTH domain